jgi:pyrroline-5-carboxylate reductase
MVGELNLFYRSAATLNDEDRTLLETLASHLAHRTMAGTAALLQGQELHPGELKDMVTSPAGTTAAGLRELERAGLRSALIEAVLAAAERSRQLA